MKIIVVLLHNNRIYRYETLQNRELTFGTSQKNTVVIEDLPISKIQVNISTITWAVYAQNPVKIEKETIPMGSIVLLDKAARILVFVMSVEVEDETMIKLPYEGIIRVGRSDSNDVVLKYPFVSGEHFVLQCVSGTVRIKDNNSTNGLYLNGRKISIARMESGDVLSIMSIEIQLRNGFLYFRNAGDKIYIRQEEAGNKDLNTDGLPEAEKLLYRRSPRIKEKLPSEDIILASAPSRMNRQEKRRGVFSSLAGSGAMVAGSILMGAASPALLAARSASLIMPISNIASNKGEGKRSRKKAEQYEMMRREKYGAYIDAQKARIKAVADEQRRIILQENPDTEECLEIVQTLNRNLWERSPEDEDFLAVRVGMGYDTLCVSVKTRQDNSSFKLEEDEISELAEQIIEETRIVDRVPARVSFLNNPSIGIVGNSEKRIALLKNILVYLCTMHSFEDIRVAGLFEKEETGVWSMFRWLPHFHDDNGQFRMLAFGENKAHVLSEYLAEIIKSRLDEQLQSETKKARSLPHYIILITSERLVEREEMMRRLAQVEIGCGITSVFAADDIRLLPRQCKYVIDVDKDPNAYDTTEVNNKFFFTPDLPLNTAKLDMFARRMAAVEMEGFTEKKTLPESIGFLEGYKVKTIQELGVARRWASSEPYYTLEAPIGILDGGKTFALDIHEKAAGPHGLVAGTTGSGKSELLQTWILSMAVNYHPHDVVFVLIDYKGGGMANLLEPLPHVVGKITNIGSGIARSLVSLQSEIRRRQKLFDQAVVNHIDKYQKLYKTGRISEPLPHLIIVADEFAELKKEEPDFMSGLVSASRVGRSLGIHLILATQKPGGIVDDQIQSNSRFRLCLKVQDAGDSREMIRRPDAARLRQAGRAYIRVGEDEYFDLFQSYYSGTPYTGEAESETEEEFEVPLVTLEGQRRLLVPGKGRKTASETDELQAVVKYIQKTAEALGIMRLPGPWLPELPESVSLEKLKISKTDITWPALPIGIYDMPKAQQQGIQTIDFSQEGHYAIYGASGTGKTTLLKTILLGIGRFYRPDEICVYIIDAGGWSLSAFDGHPNIGGVALDKDTEKVEKLQKMLLEEFERRKSVFLKNAVSSLSAYREDISKDLPAVVLVIDNIVPLFELYPDIEEFLVTIARDGATYGIYLLYTANSTSGVRYRILQSIRGVITFTLTDKGDYLTLVGRPEEALPKVTGRAYFKGNPPVIFQAAKPYDIKSDREMNDFIRVESQGRASEWTGPQVKRIPVMPEKVTWEMLWHACTERTMLSFGVSYDSLSPAVFDLSERYGLLITGSIGSGKSKMLYSAAIMYKHKDPQSRIIAVDSTAGGLSGLKNNEYRYLKTTDAEGVTHLMKELVDILNNRKKQQNTASKDMPDFDEKKYALSFEQIVILVDDLKEFVDTVSDENRNTMERIVRMAQGLGVLVLCAGRLADMSKYNEIETLTRAVISNQNGLVLDGVVSDYPYFRTDMKYTERSSEAGEGNAYMFSGGRCIKIKLPSEKENR